MAGSGNHVPKQGGVKPKSGGTTVSHPAPKNLPRHHGGTNKGGDPEILRG